MRRAGPVVKKTDDRIEKMKKEDERRKETTNGQGIGQAHMVQAWSESVRQHLGKPHRKVTVGDFEEWQKKVFRPGPGEFDNPTSEQKEWYSKLLKKAAAFRKWSGRATSLNLGSSLSVTCTYPNTITF